jgi:hypothetical protein
LLAAERLPASSRPPTATADPSPIRPHEAARFEKEVEMRLTPTPTVRRIAADAVVLIVLAIAMLHGASAIGASRVADAGFGDGSSEALVPGSGPAGYGA